jgi:hypothetical protein
MGCCGLDWSGSGMRQVESTYEIGKKPSDSIRCWESTDLRSSVELFRPLVSSLCMNKRPRRRR